MKKQHKKLKVLMLQEFFFNFQVKIPYFFLAVTLKTKISSNKHEKALSK